MFGWWRRWQRRRVLAGTRLDEAVWQQSVAATPVLTGLNAEELARLRELVLLFLAEKAIEPVAGVELDPVLRLRLGLLACLPILNLGLDYYRNWYAVVVYPGGFLARHEFVDEDGTVHQTAEPLVGEAWEQGPVILSLEELAQSGGLDGFNVAIHEFAHKLDMLVDGPNGLPPLHADMRVEDWSTAFEAAYADLRRRAEAGEETELDPYGAESPGEFFAVVSEAFFEIPHLLAGTYPAVYHQLRAFYRQDPRDRLPRPD